MKKAVVFFVLAGICWVVAGVFVVRFALAISEQADASVATVEAPGSAIFPIEEAGVFSLWHNYRGMAGGVTVQQNPVLPSGFAFELKEMSTGDVVPFTSSGADISYSTGNTSKTGLGSFAVTTPGDYELTVTAPPGESRVISLSAGSFMEGFGKLFGQMGLAVALGILGFIFAVIGTVLLILNSRSRRQATPPPSSPPTHAA